jgi:hypothetical protein
MPNSMVQKLCWKLYSYFLRLMKPKVHYHVHKSPPATDLCPELEESSPLHSDKV